MTTKIKIPMSERRPLQISIEDWPIVAVATRHDGQVECQAPHVWAIRVREHQDGRRIVYGSIAEGQGGGHAGSRGAEGGFLVLPSGGKPDETETVRAIRRVAGIIDNDALGSECIANLPAEEFA